MSLLGSAALAMWWDIRPDARSDFQDWHAHEHFPERLGVPGFERATRWCCAEGGDGMFVVYELADFGVLSSEPYVARLNAPTAWSTRLMPHHRNMIRAQCRVLASRGGAIARFVSTLRLSPMDGRRHELRAHLARLIDERVGGAGLTGGHLLEHETPKMPPTLEQRIRNNTDRTADWVLMLCGYDRETVVALSESVFGEEALEAAGAQAGASRGLYTMAYSAVARDVV